MRSRIFIISFSFVVLCAALSVQSLAQIDFFSTREQKNQRTPRFSRPAKNNQTKARVVFFIDPGCHLCPEEASKLQTELTKMGWKYEIEGIFRGDPIQVGKYLAELRTYPFNFELGLDMDGRIAKQYGVKAFPTAVVEVDGKRAVVSRASELSERLR
jgi:peroxiredoxin